MSERLKVKFAFLCDDVRREDNGKFIFIGVYGENIIVHQLPANIALSLVIWTESPKEVIGPLSLRVSVNGKHISTGGGQIKVGAGSSVTGVQPLVLSVANAGTLSIEMKFDDDPWEPLLATEVSYQPISVSIEQPPHAGQSRAS